MKSSQTAVLAAFTVLHLFILVQTQDVNIIYTIREELAIDFKIGNVVNDSGILDPSVAGVEYRILTQGNEFARYFRIDNKTGDLYISNILDRESLSDCEFADSCKLPLEVIAQSPGGTYFKKVRVQFIIEDINDIVPRFPTNETRVVVSESFAAGHVLPPIEGAIDLDIGNNSVQSYDIVPSNTPFAIEYDSDSSSSIKPIKLKLVRKVDREVQDSYSFKILAIDGGIPRLTGSIDVVAEITDVNDNKPTFSKPVYNTTIDEDVAVNTVILNISAHDPDAGDNGKVSYRLSPYQSEEIRNMFAIHPQLGNLSIVTSLARQPGETLKIIVEASDNAAQPRISQVFVYARVLDSVNDAPEIHANLLSNTNRASIAENATIGAAVAHIKVTDDDLGLNGYVNCSVTRGKRYFRLEKFDVNEYKVVVSSKLDRETTSLHDVTVTCQDSGKPSLTASKNFTVEVTDVNEEPPKFIQNTFRVQMTENNHIGANVTSVSAIDTDSGLNAKVRYSVMQTGKFDFVIDPDSGLIRANFVLDREDIPEITFKVAATDSGSDPKTGLATVIVTLLDTNDHAPEFTDPVLTFTVPENQPINTFVGHVNATDADVGDNGIVTFSLVDASVPFRVTSDGQILTTERLDREQYPHGLAFKLLAHDKGQPAPMTSTAFVTIHISDENDNAPVMTFPNDVNRTITMIYDLPKGSIIGKVEAEDRDYNVNAKLSYFLHEKSAHLLFRIDNESGEIRTARKFLEQDVNRYAFTVIVEDQGVPKLAVNHTLTVVIISNNYIPPTEYTEEGDNYLLIAVIISCVTIVLAGVIILVIFLLRRIDQKKREHESATSQEEHKKTEPKPDLYDPIDTSQKQNKAKIDKRVSFSDSLESIDTPIERPTFKMTPSKEKIEEVNNVINSNVILWLIHNGSYFH